MALCLLLRTKPCRQGFGWIAWKTTAKTRYVNDKQITDHYAIIPTGQGLGATGRLQPLQEKIYQVICRRFLSIFYPAAVYQKYSLEMEREKEHFFANFKVLLEPGYLKVADINYRKKENGQGQQEDLKAAPPEPFSERGEGTENDQENKKDMENPEFLEKLKGLKKGDILDISDFAIKEGETSPPKRYTSGSMILAMESRDERHRNQRHQGGDPEKTGSYQVPGLKSENPGHYPYPFRRIDF